MAEAVYLLGAITCLACTVLLLRGFARGRKRLLLWSGLCFAMLTGSNLLVFLDLVIYPDVSLYRARLLTAAFGMAMLLYGLIWEDR